MSYKALSAHVRDCLPGTDIEARIEAAAAARQMERDRAREIETRKSFARHEAEVIFVLLGQGGETAESLRQQIPLSASNIKTLRDLFGADFANEVEQFRLQVLAAFDEMSAAPPLGFAEKLARKRASLAKYYENYAPNGPVGARGAYGHNLRQAAQGGDEWNV